MNTRNQPDQALDAVLNALRETAVPAGLEVRVLRGAQARVAASADVARASWWGRPVVWRSLAGCFAIGAIVAAVKFSTPSNPARPAAVANLGANAPLTGAHPADPTTPAVAPPPRISLTRMHAPPQDSWLTLDAADQQLLDDLHSPGYPAPPLPPAPVVAPTQQERLLARATRHRESIELAQLEPLREAAFRAQEQARERSAVRQYVAGLLAPLAAAERLNPTAPPADEPPATPSSTITAQDPNQP